MTTPRQGDDDLMTHLAVLFGAWLAMGGLGVIGGIVGVRRAARRLRRTARTAQAANKELLAA